MPYVRAIANHGWRDALRADAALAHGLNTHDGSITNDAIAVAHDMTAVTLNAAMI
jgi:alanine dehydrogenase